MDNHKNEKEGRDQDTFTLGCSVCNKFATIATRTGSIHVSHPLSLTTVLSTRESIPCRREMMHTVKVSSERVKVHHRSSPTSPFAILLAAEHTSSPEPVPGLQRPSARLSSPRSTLRASLRATLLVVCLVCRLACLLACLPGVVLCVWCACLPAACLRRSL